MSQVDISYNTILNAIVSSGYTYETENRPGIKCHQIGSVNLELSLEKLPLLTTKEMHWKSIVTELIWFMRGEGNIKYLLDRGVNIWNKDAYKFYHRTATKMGAKEIFELDEYIALAKEGTTLQIVGKLTKRQFPAGYVGANYGVQWRDWHNPDEQYGCDQLKALFDNLSRPNPINRRHIVTAWNPAELSDTALPPCHWSWEVIVQPLTYIDRINFCHPGDQEHLSNLWDEMAKGNEEAETKLKQSLSDIPKYSMTLKWHQRSVDTFLGLPFNIASYAVLANFIGLCTEMVPTHIVGDLSNVHIYGPHMDVAKEQIARNPTKYGGPDLTFSDRLLEDVQQYKKGKLSFNKLIQDLVPEDFILENYESYGKLKADMFEETN